MTKTPEEVLRAWESCVIGDEQGLTNCGACCEYHNEKGGEPDCYELLNNDVRAALAKQVPAEVVRCFPGLLPNITKCPSCEDLLPIAHRPRYRENCGQALLFAEK